MQLRASELLGTDLVALAIWPDDHDPGGETAAGQRGDSVGEMPVEVRCVDVALAAALEELVERAGPRGGAEGRQERAARGLLRWLVARAQRHQQD